MVDIQWVEMITAAEWCDHTPQQPPAGCGQRHQGGLDSGPGNDEALYKPLNCHSKIKQIIYIFRVRSWDIPPLVLKCRLDRSKYNTGSDYRCHIMTCLPHSIARTLVPWLQFPWIRVQQRCTFYTWYYFIPPAARVTAGGPPPRPHHRNERGVGAAPGLALCLMVPGHSLKQCVTRLEQAGGHSGYLYYPPSYTGIRWSRVFGSLTAHLSLEEGIREKIWCNNFDTIFRCYLPRGTRIWGSRKCWQGDFCSRATFSSEIG